MQYLQGKISRGTIYTGILRDALEALKMPLDKNRIIKLASQVDFKNEIDESLSLSKIILDMGHSNSEDVGSAEIVGIKSIELNYQGKPISINLLVATSRPSQGFDMFGGFEFKEMVLQYSPTSESYEFVKHE